MMKLVLVIKWFFLEFVNVYKVMGIFKVINFFIVGNIRDRLEGWFERIR